METVKCTDLKRCLILGGAGFIGSHCIEFLLEKNFRIMNYDILDYSANKQFLAEIKKNENYEFVQGDIGDRIKLSDTLRTFKPNFIINFAAQSHVDTSIKSPEKFLDTNVKGVLNILECLKDYFSKYGLMEHGRFIQISTDEVYGSKLPDEAVGEDTILNPSNVYSVSKASADLLVLSYVKTYRLPALITRCCNNYGPRQHVEKFIPKVLDCLQAKKSIPIYGEGTQMRQWIHAKDHAEGIFAALQHGTCGEIYNIGDDNYLSNIQLVNLLCSKYDSAALLEQKASSELVEFVPDRIGHDTSYSISSIKLRNICNWQPKINFSTGLNELIRSKLTLGE